MSSARTTRRARGRPSSKTDAARVAASVTAAAEQITGTTRRKRPHNPSVARLGRVKNPVLRLARVLGPGFVTGASDDDPSGIGTYATVGASVGYGALWTAPLTLPLMAAVQYACAKIGLVTGKGLAGVMRTFYPRWLLYPTVLALFVANAVNVGADLGAIAAAINLLVPSLPVVVLVLPIGLAILALQAFGTYHLIERVFRWLALALVAYVGAAFLSNPDWGEVLRGSILPSLPSTTNVVSMLVAILGTTISPYLFFWQASFEVETELGMGRRHLWQRKGATERELHYAALDVNVGMLFSNLVMYSVILATAATLHRAGQTDIESAAQAAGALRPIAGDLSTVLFALGLIGGGVLAVPILAGSAAYAASEAFGWKYGLDRNPGRAPQFYAVIAVAVGVGIAMNFLGINPIDALFFAAVVNGLVAPALLVLIMLISNNRRIMGKRTNSPLTNALGWTTAAVMSAAAVAFVITSITGSG